MAPILFNLFLSDFPEALNEVNSHAPKLANLQLSNLLYADDAVLLSKTKIGLQRLMDATADYSVKNELVINNKKMKILAVRPGRLLKTAWVLNSERITKSKCHKYLGVTFNNNGRYKTQLEEQRKKGVALSFALSSIHKNLLGPKFTPTLQVAQAKVIPTLTYGSEALKGLDSGHLDKIIAKIFRTVFQLPTNTSSAQIRLELGICNQSLARLMSFLMCCHKLRASKEGSLAQFLWTSLHTNQWRAGYEYWEIGLKILSLKELWDLQVS